MPTLNSLLETGKRALIVNQDVLSTVGHNISNVNTEGYSRQRAELSASEAMDNIGYGQIGTGVEINDITRARDHLLDVQYRKELTNFSKWEKQDAALAQIEDIFLEPSDTGFNEILQGFWDAWSDLANDPSSPTARTVLLERATQVTESLNKFDQDITAVQQLLNDEFAMKVGHLNDLAEGLADLNRRIRTVESVGQKANDLRDQRDMILDEMSAMANINTAENTDGSVNVYLNGDMFVQDNEVRLLDTRVTSNNGVRTDRLIWDDNKKSVEVSGGELAGLSEVRDNDAEFVKEQLDELAAAIVEEVNALHNQGYTLDGSAGGNFFDPNYTGAGSIKVTDAILSDIDNIVAAGTSSPGDNTVAMDIAALSGQLIMNDGLETFGDNYASTVAELAARKQTANMYTSQSEAIKTQLGNTRQSVQGVVLDEELTNMIVFQRAYGAAARIIQVANEMMNTIISIGR